MSDRHDNPLSLQDQVEGRLVPFGGQYLGEPQSPRRHPNIEHLLSLFEYAHLPPHLGAISHPFWSLAHEMADHFKGNGIELTAGLRKLLEAKDCMVRQAVIDHRAVQEK